MFDRIKSFNLENYLEKSVKNARDMYFKCNMYFFILFVPRKCEKTVGDLEDFWGSCLNN